MTAPDKVAELVERFADHRQSYLSGSLSEQDLRVQFLNPFFEALGWDVYNKQGYSEAYKEVIHEYSLKVGSRTEAPDYCLRAQSVGRCRCASDKRRCTGGLIRRSGGL